MAARITASAPKKSEEHQGEPWRENTVAEDFVHGGDGEDRLIFVHGGHHAADFRGQCGRIKPRFHDQIHVFVNILPQRVIYFETRRVREPVHFRVKRRRLRSPTWAGSWKRDQVSPHESFADGILVGPIALRVYRSPGRTRGAVSLSASVNFPPRSSTIPSVRT